jgi:hypothetical protein
MASMHGPPTAHARSRALLVLAVLVFLNVTVWAVRELLT